MTPKLIQELQDGEREALAQARKTYLESLPRSDNPRPGDAKRMQDAMATLGYDAGRLESDHRIIRQAESLEKEAAAFTSEHDEKHDAAWDALSAYIYESERIAAEREKERQRLDLEATLLSNRRDAARRAGDKLRELRQSHRELFGLPEPEPVTAPDLASHGFSVLSCEPESEKEKAIRRPFSTDWSNWPQPGPGPTSAERQATDLAGLE